MNFRMGCLNSLGISLLTFVANPWVIIGTVTCISKIKGSMLPSCFVIHLNLLQDHTIREIETGELMEHMRKLVTNK